MAATGTAMGAAGATATRPETFGDLQEQLRQVKRASVSTADSTFPFDHGNYVDFSFNQTFSRNANGDLIGPDGKRVRDGTDIYKCSGFSAKDGDCKNIVEFLMGKTNASGENELKSLIEELIDNKSENKKIFAETLREKVKELHPVLVARVLEYLGFKSRSVYDVTAGRNLNKIESVHEWLKANIQKSQYKFEGTSKITGSDNEILCLYLDFLVQFLNANPSILNKGYDGATNETVGKVELTDYAKQLGIKEPQATTKINYPLVFGRMRQHLLIQRPNMLEINNNGWHRVFNPDMVFRGVQAGGAPVCQKLIRDMHTNGVEAGSALFRKLFNSLINDLRLRGKTLDSTDKANIEKKFDSMKKLEDELIKTLCYYDMARNAMDAFGDTSNQTVTDRQLQQVVDRAQTIMDRQNGQYTNVINYMEKLYNEVAASGNINSEDI